LEAAQKLPSHTCGCIGACFKLPLGGFTLQQ
jgi:hypothetical protein